MKKTIKIIDQNQENMSDILKNDSKTDLLFLKVQKDTIGKSGSNPTWGHVYESKEGDLKYKGIALHKEYDYDFPKAAFGEKVWSIFEKEILDASVRVPEIEIVEQIPGYEEIVSYRLMDNDKEDMIHIKDTFFNKFEREEMKAKKDIYTIDEILECVRLQIGNEENYKKIEKDMIQVILLDGITNNGDRHALNWGVVRDEKTNKYSLAVFDHASSFKGMLQKSFLPQANPYFNDIEWSTSYITVGKDTRRNDIGSMGKVLVEYISEKYPQYFEEFYAKLDVKLPEILESIQQENMKIDYKEFTNQIKLKKRLLEKLINRGELEYE